MNTQEKVFVRENLSSRTKKDNFLEFLSNKIKLEMIKIPKGNFLFRTTKNEKSILTDDFQQYPIEISEFWIGKYPVTQGQWFQITYGNLVKTDDCFHIIQKNPEKLSQTKQVRRNTIYLEKNKDVYRCEIYACKSNLVFSGTASTKNFDDNYKERLLKLVYASNWRTNEEYLSRNFLENTIRYFGDYDKEKDSHPITKVSWFDAMKFCEKLSNLTGKNYRLPSEMEWEYACRSGTQTQYSFGDKSNPDYCNFYGDHNYTSLDEDLGKKATSKVGSYPPNKFGLYDMHGNVWEWCQDNWREDYHMARPNARACEFAGTTTRVIRGGSWFSYPQHCCSASRLPEAAGHAFNHIGFRVVCSR